MPVKQKRKSFFGVRLPVWEDDTAGSGCATITFVLQGRIISKKNNQMAAVSKKAARNWLFEQKKAGAKPDFALFEKALGMAQAKFVGNKLYSQCQKQFLPVLAAQKAVWEQRLAGKGLQFPLKKAALTLRFYFKENRLTDTVNKQQTVQDLLQEAGIIANDDYKTINPITAASKCYKGQIDHNITLVRLSFQLPKRKVHTVDELK
jgi:hypothetical protein